VIAAGQSIGNYRILSKIGTGGMGAVYLAEHPLIGKRVALKVIHRELANNRDVVSRFFQEARSVNKIGNEHIVEIHDFAVTPEGDHFFIMEYLEGRTLASILSQEKPLEVMRSLHVGAQIASALAAAHAAGIIHRDLKPDNIMLMQRLGDRDFVKVLDFGLAKVFSAATAVKTAAGVLLGTPQYMSPEACESKGDVDHRTDIYALGVLLFEMMTGVLPFDGESMGEILVKQVTTLPPVPRAFNPAIPPSVEQILLRCLAKRVDARFATMLQLREALLDPEAYLRGSPPIAPARSVGPGDAPVDAKTVMVHAAQHQQTRIAIGNPLALPLPAPARSLPGQASAPTMLGSPGAHVLGRRATTGMPALAQPQEPKMNTMRIATPLGYSSRPPRKVWSVVVVFALLLGLGGGGLVVGLSGRGAANDVAADAGVGSTGSAAQAGSGGGGAGGPSEPTTDAAGARPGASSGSAAAERAGGSAAGGTAGSAAAERAGGSVAGETAGSAAAGGAPRAIVHLSIDSVPPGATVSGPDGDALGRTPLKLDWPISDLPVTFELRLTGYKNKKKQTVVNSNTALHIELERSLAGHHGGPGSGAKTGSGGNGLMRPDE
jgi:serine/threonine-protein kinase